MSISHSFKIPSVGPMKRYPEVVQVTNLGHYANFNKVVTSDFIQEMVADAFLSNDVNAGITSIRTSDFVLFVSFDDVMTFLADMSESVAKEIADYARRGLYGDVENMTAASLNYWLDAIREMIKFQEQYEKKHGARVETLVISSNDNF